MRILLVLSAVLFGLVACSGEGADGLFGGGGGAAGASAGSSIGCVPGHQVACACQWDPSDGIQVCAPDGSGYGPCEGCQSAPGSAASSTGTGTGGTGGSGGDGGAGTGAGGQGGPGGGGGSGGAGGTGGVACVPKLACENDLNICEYNDDGCGGMSYCGPCGGDGSLNCDGSSPRRCQCEGPIFDPDNVYPFICSMGIDTGAACDANGGCQGYKCGGAAPQAKAPANCTYLGLVSTKAGTNHAWCCY